MLEHATTSKLKPRVNFGTGSVVRTLSPAFNPLIDRAEAKWGTAIASTRTVTVNNFLTLKFPTFTQVSVEQIQPKGNGASSLIP